MLQFIYASLAAIFYAINIPCSKLLLTKIPAASMAGLLYLRAGIAMLLFKEKISGRLWISIILITLASMILSFENISSLKQGIFNF